MTICASTLEDTTRTALQPCEDGFNVVWSEGDRILVGGQEFTLVSGEGTTSGIFEGPVLENGSYDAFYACSANNIPMTQTHTQGRISNSPMSAVVTVSGGKSGPINFRNMGGLLHLCVKNVQAAQARDIRVYGNLATSTLSFFLDCGDDCALLSEDGADFYIAMQEGVYSDVRFEITEKAGTSVSKKMKAGRTLDIVRSQITDVVFTVKFDGNYPSYHKGYEYVDLGLSVMWAACNVGASSPSEAGDYYSWGETETKDDYSHDNYTFLGSENLDPESDAASVKRGGGWRTPSPDEVRELLTGCDWSWAKYPYTSVYGYKVTSNKNHKYIFLPVTGMKDGTSTKYAGERGLYWTSSADGIYPYALVLSSQNNSVMPTYPYYGYAVRAVCDL